MKTLFLWVKGKGWKPFKYESIDDIMPELEERNIIISSENVQLGNNVHIGNRVLLDNVTIGDNIIIGDKSRICDTIIITNNSRCENGSAGVYEATIGDTSK